MQLNPNNWRYVTYQISVASDVGTSYYPRLIVKNTKTLVTLYTINLTNQGNGLYTGSYQLPTDSTGNGYQVVEILTVYTDSGHTVPSPNYEIVATVIDVNYITSAVQSIGTGGEYEDQTDYKLIAKLLAEEIGKIPKTKLSTKNLEEKMEEIIKLHSVHHMSMLQGFDGHTGELNKGFDEVNKNLSGVGESVSKLPLAEMLSGVHGKLDALEKKFIELTYAQTQILNHKQEFNNSHTQAMQDLHDEFKTQIGQAKKDISDTLGDYFSSVDTMTVTKGVPRREYKEDPMEKYRNIAKTML